jgi:hypothetical protein
MKIIYCLLVIIVFSACGNKKAEIVEEIKKTKNELAEAEISHKQITSAANKLESYYSSLEASKKYNSKQMQMDAQVYKEGYEMAIQQLRGISPDTLKDSKKLNSVAFKYEMKANDLKRRIDSLELELKKY